MLTEKDKKEIAKNIYISGINSKLGRLEFQRSRIFPFDYKNLKANPGHDADFYMVLLRRLYREVEELSKIDSRVANLKGTYGKTVKKLKIRDHYEHKINYDEFPETSPGIKISCGLVLNETNPHIISGQYKWFLNKDHEKFIKFIKEVSNLYPFKKQNDQMINNDYWKYNKIIPATLEEKKELFKYENWMFCQTCKQLRLTPKPKTNFEKFKYNLLVESLAMHCRILIDFFYNDKKNNKNDLIAQDMLLKDKNWKKIRPKLTNILKNAKEKASKQSAHLSSWRIKIEKDGIKKWNFVKIFNDMQIVIKKFKSYEK